LYGRRIDDQIEVGKKCRLKRGIQSETNVNRTKNVGSSSGFGFGTELWVDRRCLEFSEGGELLGELNAAKVRNLLIGRKSISEFLLWFTHLFISIRNLQGGRKSRVHF
jgi:hypothetical protein